MNSGVAFGNTHPQTPSAREGAFKATPKSLKTQRQTPPLVRHSRRQAKGKRKATAVFTLYIIKYSKKTAQSEKNRLAGHKKSKAQRLNATSSSKKPEVAKSPTAKKSFMSCKSFLNQNRLAGHKKSRAKPPASKPSKPLICKQKARVQNQRRNRVRPTHIERICYEKIFTFPHSIRVSS